MMQLCENDIKLHSNFSVLTKIKSKLHFYYLVKPSEKFEFSEKLLNEFSVGKFETSNFGSLFDWNFKYLKIK